MNLISEIKPLLQVEYIKRLLIGDLPDTQYLYDFFQAGIFPDPETMKIVCSHPLTIGKEIGNGWPSDAFTMIGKKRMDNIHFCLDYVRVNDIDGDFIETGVWKGGACIFAKSYFDIYNMQKKVYVADSFQGVPPPEIPQDEGCEFHNYTPLSISLETVKKNFQSFHCLDENVQFVKGWFKDTMPDCDIKKISVLRCDGDLYKSTMDVLQSCYHKVANQGFVIIDDYGIKQCEMACHDFWNTIGKPDIAAIDGTGIFWQVAKLNKQV